MCLGSFFWFSGKRLSFLHHSGRMSFVSPLVFFLRPVSCFRGARNSSMMFPCVFAASHKARALFPALGLFWSLSRQAFLCFLVSWTNMLVSRRPSLLPFCIVDLQGHIFVPAGAARPPTRRQMGSPGLFFPRPGGRFAVQFLLLFYIFRNAAIW